MINEVLEVKDYLEGNNISEKCMYRICYLIAKWFHSQGLSPLENREAIFDWGKQNHVYIKYNVNALIYQAMEDKTPLRDHIKIYISERDINEILRRFDSKNCRLLSLAFLTYAKAIGAGKDSFPVLMTSMANWLHLDNGNISRLYLPELIDFGYLTKTEAQKTFTWNKQVKSRALTVRMNVDTKNEGEYLLKDNDIFGLYDEIFCQSAVRGCV
ncbi:hypothetical protein [Anaerolentibacter hominis]|uniref:hypothetical protein n=1 Tax=Anaerolentibacter hominis TaxID=3079009 RepID=UPI0031B87D0A